MKYKDIALNSNYDLDIVNCDFRLTDNSDITLQKLKQTLKTIRGEWQLDQSLGLPYFDEILVKNPFLDRIKSIFIKAIQSVEEVVSITSLDVSVNDTTRTLNVNFEVVDNKGFVIAEEVTL
jgi:hypothetical protein